MVISFVQIESLDNSAIELDTSPINWSVNDFYYYRLFQKDYVDENITYFVDYFYNLQSIDLFENEEYFNFTSIIVDSNSSYYDIGTKTKILQNIDTKENVHRNIAHASYPEFTSTTYTNITYPNALAFRNFSEGTYYWNTTYSTKILYTHTNPISSSYTQVDTITTYYHQHNISSQTIVINGDQFEVWKIESGVLSYTSKNNYTYYDSPDSTLTTTLYPINKTHSRYTAFDSRNNVTSTTIYHFLDKPFYTMHTKWWHKELNFEMKSEYRNLKFIFDKFINGTYYYDLASFLQSWGELMTLYNQDSATVTETQTNTVNQTLTETITQIETTTEYPNQSTTNIVTPIDNVTNFINVTNYSNMSFSETITTIRTSFTDVTNTKSELPMLVTPLLLGIGLLTILRSKKRKIII